MTSPAKSHLFCLCCAASPILKMCATKITLVRNPLNTLRSGLQMKRKLDNSRHRGADKINTFEKWEKETEDEDNETCWLRVVFIVIP